MGPESRLRAVFDRPAVKSRAGYGLARSAAGGWQGANIAALGPRRLRCVGCVLRFAAAEWRDGGTHGWCACVGEAYAFAPCDPASLSRGVGREGARAVIGTVIRGEAGETP